MARMLQWLYNTPNSKYLLGVKFRQAMFLGYSPVKHLIYKKKLKLHFKNNFYIQHYMINSNTVILNNQQHPFHLVKPSPWPILVAFSVCLSLISVVFGLHDIPTDECKFLKLFAVGNFFFLFAIIS